MKNTNYIAPNEYNLFDSISLEKTGVRNTALLGIRTRIHQYYTTYLTNLPALQLQSRSSISKRETTEREALNHCFNTPTASFKPYRGLIKSGQSGFLKRICPYCLVNESDTLDHYIPKAAFPEFSTLIKNLIPCCSQCNKLKDELWKSGSQRRIIHFYNDTFLNQRFLFGRITVTRVTALPVIKFYLQQPNGMSNYDYSIVRFHFKDLNLLTRYNGIVNDYISGTVKEIENFVNTGATSLLELQTSLTEAYSAKSLSFSINYFGGVVYDAFANNTRYLNSFL